MIDLSECNEQTISLLVSLTMNDEETRIILENCGDDTTVEELVEKWPKMMNSIIKK